MIHKDANLIDSRYYTCGFHPSSFNLIVDKDGYAFRCSREAPTPEGYRLIPEAVDKNGVLKNSRAWAFPRYGRAEGNPVKLSKIEIERMKRDD